MIVYTPTQARKNFFQLPQKMKDNEEIRITFKSGDAILVDSDDYNNLLETIAVLSDPVVSRQLKNEDTLEISSYKTVHELRNEMES